jgi:hypothetical protein
MYLGSKVDSAYKNILYYEIGIIFTETKCGSTFINDFVRGIMWKGETHNARLQRVQVYASLKKSWSFRACWAAPQLVLSMSNIFWTVHNVGGSYLCNRAHLPKGVVVWVIFNAAQWLVLVSFFMNQFSRKSLIFDLKNLIFVCTKVIFSCI